MATRDCLAQENPFVTTEYFSSTGWKKKKKQPSGQIVPGSLTALRVGAEVFKSTKPKALASKTGLLRERGDSEKGGRPKLLLISRLCLGRSGYIRSTRGELLRGLEREFTACISFSLEHLRTHYVDPARSPATHFTAMQSKTSSFINSRDEVRTGGFFLACEDFGRMIDSPFPSSACFFFFKWMLGRAH